MRIKRLRQLAAILPVFLAATAFAQMGGRTGMGMGGFHGVWNPVIGQGAVYSRTTADGQTTQQQIAIVGQETVNGKTGYWLELAMDNPRAGGTVLTKVLLVKDMDGVQTVRVIVQPPGRGPMEMPMRQQPPEPADLTKQSQDLGSETITVPAGTFTCEHLKTPDGDDEWVSTKVTPWGMVKRMGKDGSSQILLKLVTDAKDQITGTPQTFDPSHMGPGGGGPPQQ